MSETVLHANPLPAGPFSCILADPPWRFATFSPKGRGRSPDGPLSAAQLRNASRQNRPERHYATMSMDDLMALPVADSAAKDCVLLMWAVDPMIPEAIALGRQWGFTYKTVGFYWAKTRKATSTRGTSDDEQTRFPMGTGYWTRANPESCLLFTRGRPKRVATDVRKLIVAPRREHSRKPDEQYERIERLVAGPYLEMFARQAWPGWSAWGNQVEKFEVGRGLASANDNAVDLFAEDAA